MAYTIRSKYVTIHMLCLILFFCFVNTTSGSGLSRYHQMMFSSQFSQEISMDFKDADLRSVLKIFSQQSGMNFIAANDIANEKITLYLDRVPVEEALERILYANGLMYERLPESNIFVVKRIERPEKKLITRIYHLKHATVPNSPFTKALDTFADRQSDSTQGVSHGEKDETGIISVLKNILSEVDGSRVTSDPRTNSVIVTDIPSQFPVIERTLAMLDIPIPQVLIEIEMLDISKQTSELLGAKYGDTLLSFSGATRYHLYPWNQNKILGSGKFDFESGPPDQTEYSAGTIDASGLNVILQFLKTATDTRSLANPKILTLNNHPAQIKISTNEAIGATRRRIEGTAEADILPERTETGIFLDVIPQVNIATGEITMIVMPQVIEAKTGGTWYGETFRDPEQRSVTSTLRVQNGETVFLGGLKRMDHSETKTKVPFLGDLPIIGGAFRHKNYRDQERELVIFITPRIVIDTQTHPALMAEAAAHPRISMPDQKQKEINRTLLLMENKIR